VSTENKIEVNRLNRDWIDWELAKKIRNTVATKLDGKVESPVGVGLATMCLNVVNAVNTMNITPQQKIQVMNDIFTFMADLLNRGWTAPPPKGKQN
jgi:hypothetical protein